MVIEVQFLKKLIKIIFGAKPKEASMHFRIGVVGFAFGLRSEALEPNPSNVALADKVHDAAGYVSFNDGLPVVVTQWEITKALKQKYGFQVNHSVKLRTDGKYLDSRGVWEEAKQEFAQRGVSRVIIIAQPFLHLPSLKKMIVADGYGVYDYRTGAIPFDDSKLNTQPWTRTKLALAIYAVKSMLGMKHGHDGRQSAT